MRRAGMMAAARAMPFACAAVFFCALADSALAQLPASELRSRRGTAWETWWRSTSPIANWSGKPRPLASAATWRAVADGIEWTELEVGGSSAALRWRIIAVRFQPSHLDLTLRLATAANRMTGTWTLDNADPLALFSVNAGQFEETGPWGWLVLDRAELRFPATGPLAAAIAIDTSGAMHFVPRDSVEHWRTRRDVRFAFQSYPVLLEGRATVPALLFRRGAMDLAHRDIRLALGQQSDGRWLLVLTRYDAFNGTMGRAPIGPTTPEMAAIMGALGAERAVALDGGISAQLQIRPANGQVLSWRGFRRVPLALEAKARKR